MSNEETTDILNRAAGLVREYRYAEARALLVNLDHPQAREWIAEIDRLTVKHAPAAPVPEKKRGGCLGIIAGLSLVGIIFVVCGLVALCGIIGGAVYLIIGSLDEQTQEAIEANNGFGTLGNPIPAAQWAKFDDGQIRITQINLEADDTVNRMYEYNAAPAAGSRFVLVYIEIQCESEACSRFDLAFHLIDAQNDDWEANSSLSLDPDFPNSVEGGTGAGWIGFEVPIGRNLRVAKITWSVFETLHFALPS